MSADRPDTSAASLTEEEWNLIRQAVRNQNDDERRDAEAVECGNCRARQVEEQRRRNRVREAGLKKIRPEGAMP